VESPSVAELVTRLRRIQRRGAVPVESGGARDWYEVMLFPPAREVDVVTAHRWLGKELPEDFLEFWRLTDGANLFLNESGLHGVGVASTELLRELQAEEIEVYGPGAMMKYVVFARVNGSGDFLVFNLETGQVLDGIHAEQPHEWRPIAASFTHWLDRLIEECGRYYWLEALYEGSAAGA
jgi:hypothetical protein